MQEVARLVFRAGLLAVVIGTVSWVLACRPTVNRARADTLAETRLQEYIRAERLNREQFDKPEVHNQGGKWLYTYEYRGAPRQSVAVIVFADGHVEVSRMSRSK